MAERTHDPVVAGERGELEKLLKDYDTALLTTRGADGHFHTRPMAMQKGRFSADELWFATWTDSQKCHDLEEDAHCALSFYERDGASTYVSVSGHGELVRDRQKIHELWDPTWKAWFPEGPEERDIALIRFVPEHAEYVHPTTGKLQVLFTVVKNLVTRKRSEPAPKKQVEMPHH